ncbi:hypothetical protein LBYZC6_43610 [Lacrimispora brassicae]
MKSAIRRYKRPAGGYLPGRFLFKVTLQQLEKCNIDYFKIGGLMMHVIGSPIALFNQSRIR